jgi:predicted transcriptional regulator
MPLNRTTVLNSLIKHETLTIVDICKSENLGMLPDKKHLNFLLKELVESGDIDTLNGVIPCTYTITEKGIEEGERLSEITS